MNNWKRKTLETLLILLLILSFISCNQIAGQKTEDDENSKITQPADNERTEPEGISESGDEAVKFQTVSEEDIKFQDEFIIPDYKTISKDPNSNIKETEGTFGGSHALWYTIENAGIVYFYTQIYDKGNSPISEPEYINYAVIGEEYTLKCGIHIGMTKKEVYDLLPNCVTNKPGNDDGIAAPGVLAWNMNSNFFPNGWCEKYDEIIMAGIKYDGELPWYLGIMLDKEGIVAAITTCYPTAG